MKLPQARITPEYIPFKGGLDVVTPMLNLSPGACRDSQNFVQDINGGYIPYQGYERYDGQTAPSDADYATLEATDIQTVTLGDTLTGNDSGATGVIVAVTLTYFVLTKLSGTFQTEVVKVGVTTKGTATGAQVFDGADTSKLHAQYKNLAADIYRDDITAVPGSGIIRGVVSYEDVQYGFRNNAGGTTVDMYKSTASGWSKVELGIELSFTSGGTFVIAEGQTIEGETSGATAILTRVVLETGTFAGGDVAGRLIYASQTGTFQAETIKVGADLNVANISGNGAAITFAIPGGRFEFKISNFGGDVNTKRLYGCDGKNRGFEFDGTVFVPIETGMITDAPGHVCAHRNHLFFSYIGSVQHSSPGTPYVWSPITGADELAMGDTITGFVSQSGASDTAALAIFTRNTIGILYGTGVSTWNLVTYKDEAGAIEYTLQTIGGTLMLDDRGITSLAASEKYGNFADATISQQVQTWLTTKRPNAISSCVLRDKSQYCLFFSDKTGLYVTLSNGKVQGMMPVFFDHVVQCIDSYETIGGTEEVYFGDSDGYIHQMEKGTSFDGGEIEAWITLAFNSSKNPTLIKRYRKATVEISGTGYYEFKFDYDLDYLSTETEQPSQSQALTATKPVELSSAIWDDTTWDAFFWDGVSLSPAYLDMTGSGVNVSLKIWSRGDCFNAGRFSGAILEYSLRRRKR